MIAFMKRLKNNPCDKIIHHQKFNKCKNQHQLTSTCIITTKLAGQNIKGKNH
jgi:hypothetical protein